MPDKLVALIAEDALKNGKPFPVKCNCGQSIPLSYPYSAVLKCGACGASITPKILAGNPSNISVADPDGTNWRPFPVQGHNPSKPES